MKRQGGFSLLEVLIAMLILSVGLLGMAGLQLNALKFNQTATVRSQATLLAYDITDRMRMNRESARSGGYVTGLTDTVVTGTARNKIDLREWKASVAQQLPSGSGAVQVTGNIVRVTVTWDESRLSNGGTQQLIFETQL